MDKKYNPKEHEEKIYKRWEKSGFFNPDNLKNTEKGNYSIALPPPNVTGSLHMGHALNTTIQDIVARFKRMREKKVLWLPGTDHAGIATQNVVEKMLQKKGKTRHELGREKFIEKVWEWKEKYGNIILDQLKKLGASCDWSRTRFTLDKKYSKAVEKTFIHYYKKGLIYRGPRIVNWCPRCSTAISDIEIKYKEEKGKLWYIKYPLENKDGFITIATTRPETMLGDTAIAVNPKDKKYEKLIGKKVILPLAKRKIPIISHHLVDKDFGTGALKITPAHDNLDWKIGQENNLEIINVIGPDAKMTKEAGKEFKGLSVKDARKKVVEKLKKENYLQKVEDYPHKISLCDRCSSPIEPQISTQWFIKMEQLAKPAIKAVAQKRVNLLPKRYQRVYLDWLENVKDWCISRQLWWGHRLPVWFCENEKNKQCFVVSSEKPKKCKKCGATKFKQSNDVLDTWFSSALWPFATLGWPEKTKDLKEFYPTSFLSTARDIIYLWVTRMVISGLEFLNKIPFKDVYFHSTILSIDGQRMSKSRPKANVNPLDMIDKYGTDATRFGLMYSMSFGQQAIKFDERNLKASRNFINKLWNISRFIDMQLENKKIEIKNIESKTLADQWILSRLNKVIKNTTDNIQNFKLGEASDELYDFIWHEFADWYLEISKIQTQNPETKNSTLKILKLILCNIIRLLHPFIPFVTEVLYSQFNPLDELVMIAPWPKHKKEFQKEKIEKEFQIIQEIVNHIRSEKIKHYKIEKQEYKKLLTQKPKLRELIKSLTKIELEI